MNHEQKKIAKVGKRKKKSRVEKKPFDEDEK